MPTSDELRESYLRREGETARSILGRLGIRISTPEEVNAFLAEQGLPPMYGVTIPPAPKE